jgi:hypothetical protein
MPMPDFLVIGAGKAGTTSIYRYLAEHPDIFVTPVKETRYFACVGEDPAKCWVAKNTPYSYVVTTREEYEALFLGRSTEAAAGEVCPQYLSWPGAAYEIKRQVPAVKMLAVLRNPVERAISSYVFRWSRGVEKGSLSSALQEERAGHRADWRSGRLLDQGLYSKHLNRFFGLFHREQIMVALYDDLLADPLCLMQDIYRFIGVDATFRPAIARRYNVTENTRPKGRLGGYLLKSGGAAAAVGNTLGALIPDAVRTRLKQPFTETLPGFPNSVRRELAEFFHDDVQTLQGLVGRDLAHWLENDAVPRSLAY